VNRRADLRVFPVSSAVFARFKNIAVPLHTEARIRQLVDQALTATSDSDIEWIAPELRSAIEEHIRLAKESLGAGFRPQRVALHESLLSQALHPEYYVVWGSANHRFVWHHTVLRYSRSLQAPLLLGWGLFLAPVR
jgi:hypothetical protein